MLWQKDENDLYINFCRDVFDERTFENANLLLGFQLAPTKSNRYAITCRKTGNVFFATTQWYDAIRSYNISLCFAENDSESNIGSLAYGNRAACFLHLKMYDKCLADIQLAIESNYPEELLPKLEKRRAVCLEQIAKNEQRTIWAPELSFEADANFHSMVNILQIQRNAEFGRHITAKSDIGVGKVVLMERAFVPSLGEKYERCDTCWKSNVNLIPCTNCTSALFCPGQCEQSPHHIIPCGMRIADDDTVNDQQMQLVRSILIAINEFSSTGALINFVEAAIRSDPKTIPSSLSNTKAKYRAFLKLSFDRKTTVENTFPTQVCFVYKTLMNHRAVRPKFPSKKYRRFLMHLIGHHLCILQSNTGGLLYSPQSPYNVTQSMCENLSILVNYMNHSCAPNISLISFNEFNVCITLRPIKGGDQLFISYFRNDVIKHNTVSRQTYLRDICEFECKCERCVTSTMPIELEKMTTDLCYQYVRKNGNKMKCSKVESGDLKMMLEKCIEFLDKFGHTTWSSELDFVVKCYEKSLRSQLKEIF